MASSEDTAQELFAMAFVRLMKDDRRVMAGEIGELAVIMQGDGMFTIVEDRTGRGRRTRQPVLPKGFTEAALLKAAKDAVSRLIADEPE